jgi:hypothetical protein
MQVFVDPSPGDIAPGSAAPVDEEHPSAWPELGTRKSRIKENVKEATKAAGTILRQTGKARRMAASRGTPKIDVFVDSVAEEDAAENDNPNTKTMPASPASVSTTSGTKTGKSINVFQDQEIAVAPPTKQIQSSGKSSISVFRDEDASLAESPFQASAHSTKSTKGKAKSPIAIFCDDEPSTLPLSSLVPAKTTKGRSKSSITVFPDDVDTSEEAEASRSKNAAKSKIAVFRDKEAQDASPSSLKKYKNTTPVSRDEDASKPLLKLTKGKIVILRDNDTEAAPSAPSKKNPTKIAVFRDNEYEETADTSSNVKSKGKLSSLADEEPAVPGKKTTSKIAVFRDDEDAQDSKPVPKSKPKGKISVFVDEEPSLRPGFTPYRDEEVSLVDLCPLLWC